MLRTQALECSNHLLTASQRCTTLVCAEFAVTREPHLHDRCEQTKHDLQNHDDGEVHHATAIFAVTRNDVCNRTRQQNHERIQHTLDQHHRDHVAIRNVRHFVTDDCFRFVRRHLIQQTGRHSDQRIVTRWTRRERIHFRRIIQRDFRRLDTRLRSLARHGFKQPLLRGILRLRDHLTTDRTQCHPLRHQQGDDRTGETKHQRINQSSWRNADAKKCLQNHHDDADHGDHGNVGQDKKENTLKH